MLNSIRADVYRLLHGKALYVTFAVYLVLVVAQLLAGETATVGVQIDGEELRQELAAEGLSDAAVAQPTQASSPEFGVQTGILAAMTQFQTLVLLALALIYAAAATDFSSGAAQNTIAAGMPRGRLYLSKLLTSFVFIELLYLTSLLIGALLGAVEGALGAGDAGVAASVDSANEPSAFSLLCAFGAQSLMALALAATGTAITFITRKGVALNSVYPILFLGMTALLSTLTFITDFDFTPYDFLLNSSRAVAIAQLPLEQVTQILAVPAVYLVLSTVLGLVMFRKAEVR
ncbi:MAG: hypothetical protein LBP24_02115 [Coriobacteriales bacterium]|jgi:hypothetical protein|nr:hypothetical protein [Coriobacteriales bacterium]